MKEKPGPGNKDLIDLTGRNHSKDQMDLMVCRRIQRTMRLIDEYPGHQPTEDEKAALPAINAAFEERWKEALAKDNSDTPIGDDEL